MQEPKNNDIICWNKEGNGFILLDYKRFIKELLSKNFKTEVFSSFIRQLNLYDFHKKKSKKSLNNDLKELSNDKNNTKTFYEFTNANFLRDQPEKINLIKRKTKNDNQGKNGQIQGVVGNELVVHPFKKFINFQEDKTKLNLGKMYKKAMKLAEIVSNLRKKIEILEGKYDFLEYCNKEFGENNKNIIGKLQKIMDKKHTLESFFSLLLTNFLDNIKLVDNTLQIPSDTNNNKVQANTQINDVRNKEIISQLYKLFNLQDNNSNNKNLAEINKNNILVNNNLISNNIISNNKKCNNLLNGINIINGSNDDNTNNNLIYNKNQINQLMEKIVDTETASTESREIKTYNKIIDFQKQYFKDLEDQNANNYLNIKKDSSSLQDNNSYKSENNFKNDKDIMNVTSNNSSLETSKNKISKKKTLLDPDESISDGVKDLL